MKFTTSVQTTTTVVVTFDDGEQPEIVKPFAPSKRIRLYSIRLRHVREADGRVNERVFGVGHRVLKDGGNGAAESIGEFGVDPKYLPEVLREPYRLALERVAS